jgi:hypothetical protein
MAPGPKIRHCFLGTRKMLNSLSYMSARGGVLTTAPHLLLIHWL